MSGNTRLQRLRHYLREEGVAATAREVTRHAGKAVESAFEGRPGYYRFRLTLLQRRYARETLTPVWVSPDDITSLTGARERRTAGHLDYVPYFKPREANWDSLPFEAEVPYGTVRGGDWDSTRADFEELLLYRGILQRFRDDVPWEETVFYTELHERCLDQGWGPDAATARVRERCDRIEQVSDGLEQDGYRSQRALNGHPLHEVTVTVARDGELLYNCEGRHRLCLAKVLGIEEIPVLVLVTHSEFDGALS